MTGLLSLSISESPAKADNSQKKEKGGQDLKHAFYFGLEYAKYIYKEPDIYQDRFVPRYGAIWMNLKGNLWGTSASYRLTWQEKIFVQPELRILYGKHAYNMGIKEKIVFRTKKSVPSLLYEPRLMVGGHIPIINKVILSPYTGIGYRFKSDDGEEVKVCNDPRNLGFYRKSNYVYVPFGVSVDYDLDNTWSVSLKGEYDWIIKAWHYSRRPETPANVYKQPNGYGLKGEASISYLYKKVKFSVSPYINYWNVRNSIRPEGRGREPYNITFESGVRLGVTF